MNKVLTPHLPTKVFNEPCGEIFITPHHHLLLCCSTCQMKLRTSEEFLTHIIAHYVKQNQANDNEDDSCSNSPLVANVTSPAAELLEPLIDMETLNETVHTNCSSDDDDDVAGKSLTNKIKLIPPSKSTNYSDTRPFKCDKCEKSFRTKYNLATHAMRHNGQKDYCCTECPKKFCTSNELEAHTRHHSGERPFICKYCGQGFTTSSHRFRHEKLHELRDSNHRPFQCEKCEKAFFNLSQLKNHDVVHTRERNHICDICNATFMRRKNMIQHRKLHNGARDFVCNLCNKSYTTKPQLIAHQSNIHDIIVDGAGGSGYK